jgi:putative phosphoesterase
MIIGLVSDTHGLLRDSVLKALAGVSLILHAGDVGGGAILDALGAIAPVRAVLGNVDGPDPSLAPQVQLTVGGLTLHMSHGHELGAPTPELLLARYKADIIVYGHTHKPLVHRAGTRLVVNPGAAGPKRFKLRPSIGRMSIANGRAEVDIVTLQD